MAEQVLTDKDKKFVDFVVKEFDRYERYHSERFEAAKDQYNFWKGKKPQRDFDWQNQAVVPLLTEAEQTISPRLFVALFPTDAPVDVLVEGEQDPLQGIKIKYLLQHYFRVSNVQGTRARMLPQVVIYGTAYSESGSWLTKRGWVIDSNGERRYTIIESRPDSTFVDFFEIFPHPAKMKMDDGLPLIRRRKVDAEYLKGMAENPFFKFENLDKALQSEPPEKAADCKKGEDYEMLEYWGPYDEDYEKDGKLMKRKAVPHWGIVINRKIKIRLMPNPYNHQRPPFTKMILFPDAKPSWFGVGIGQIGMPIQDRVQKLVNQRLDNVDLVLNRQGLFNGNDPLIDKKKLQTSKPGKFYRCSDTTTSIKWMDIPDVTASSYKEEEIAKQDFRESTGATTPLMPGEVSDQHRTAMGIQLMQGAAGVRFRPVLRMMELDDIQETAMFFFSNLKQFMTNREWILITGDNGTTEPIQVSPEEIQAKVFFIPTGISETVNKELQVGQLLRYKEITMNDPTVNRAEINKRIAELFGFKDIQKLMVPSFPPQGGTLNMQQKMLVAQRAAEGAPPDQIAEEIAGPPPLPMAGSPPGPAPIPGQSRVGGQQ